MRRSRVLLALGAVAGLGTGAIWMNQSSAFTQQTAFTSIGHEAITVFGGHQAGGWFREPGHNEVTGEHNSCRWPCAQFDTNNSRLWSVVMGQRYADFGGYSAAFQTKCFNATAQDSDGAQYQHALRKKCDVGLDGLKRTHSGTVALIKDRFMKAVHAPDNMIWFQDGGGMVVTRYKANHPELILGTAAHALQDSFSEEHSVRSNNWHSIADLKTYVETSSHSHHEYHAEWKYKEDHFKFKPGIGSLHFPNEHHGDYPFKTMFSNSWNNTKDSAKAASEATADLLKAFEAARLAPHSAEALWRQFEAKWLTLAPSAEAMAAVAHDPGCSAPTGEYGAGMSNNGDWRKSESDRVSCLRERGTEPDLAPPAHLRSAFGDYPKWCVGACHDNAVDHLRDAITRAGHAAEHALSDVANFFAHIAQAVEDFFTHTWHSFDRCYGESGDFGRRGGDHYMSAAHSRADQFWMELGNAIDMLSLEDRHKAVDQQWQRVKAEIFNHEPNVRNRTCDRVRGWFTRGSSKNKGEENCRRNFDAHVGPLGADLDHLYTLHMMRNLPPTTPPAPAPAPMPHPVHLGHLARLAPLTHGALSAHHETNLKSLEGHYKNELADCKTRVGAEKFHAGTGAELCEHRVHARLSILGLAQPPAQETPDQIRDRLYEELHACLQSPMVRFHNPGRADELCKQHYENGMAEHHLKPRSPSDEPAGHGPPVEK